MLLAFFSQTQLPKNVLWSCFFVVIAGAFAVDNNIKKLEVFTIRLNQFLRKVILQTGSAHNIIIFFLGLPLR